MRGLLLWVFHNMRAKSEVRTSRSSGLAVLVTAFSEHRVSGDVLCLMDAESLKEVGIATIGQRLAILKAVYLLKLAQQIPIEPDDYVPPCESHILSHIVWAHVILSLT